MSGGRRPVTIRSVLRSSLWLSSTQQSTEDQEVQGASQKATEVVQGKWWPELAAAEGLWIRG